jgi:nucleoside-diphosphate-sugar epimerase
VNGVTASSTETLLLTGAQGFLGRHIARVWLRVHPGGRVVGVGRSPYSATHFTYDHTIAGAAVRAGLPPTLLAEPTAGSFEYQRVDVTDACAVAALVDEVRPGVVVHSAAALRGEPLAKLIDANVLAAACLAHAVGALAGRPRLVVVSSGSIYGLGDGSAGAPAEPDPYAVTKRAAERAVGIEAAMTGLSAVAARVFNLAGAGVQDRHLPGRVALELAAMERHSRTELRLGSLDALRDVIDVRDAAEAVVEAACASDDVVDALPDSAGVRTVDVGTGTAQSMREIVRLQVDAMGLTGRVEVVESEARALGAPALCADPASLRALGAVPAITIDETVAEMATYARSQL